MTNLFYRLISILSGKNYIGGEFMDINSLRIVRDDMEVKKVEKSKTIVVTPKTKRESAMGCLKLSDYMVF